MEAITVSFVVQGRQEGLEAASGRTRGTAVKENTVKYVPWTCKSTRIQGSAERGVWRNKALGRGWHGAHFGDLPCHPQLMSL